MKRWRRVENNELNAIWDDLRERRQISNGCTHAELCRIYGAENVKHKMGVGWFKLTAREQTPARSG